MVPVRSGPCVAGTSGGGISGGLGFGVSGNCIGPDLGVDAAGGGVGAAFLNNRHEVNPEAARIVHNNADFGKTIIRLPPVRSLEISKEKCFPFPVHS